MKQWDKVAALKKLVEKKVKQYAWKGEQFYEKFEKATSDAQWIKRLEEELEAGKSITKQNMLHMNKIYKYWREDDV